MKAIDLIIPAIALILAIAIGFMVTDAISDYLTEIQKFCVDKTGVLDYKNENINCTHINCCGFDATGSINITNWMPILIAVGFGVCMTILISYIVSLREKRVYKQKRCIK